MVLVRTPVEFVDRSLALLQAHPNTARITTTYHISPPPSKPSKPRPSKSTSKPTDDDKDKPRTPRGSVTLKTYDPLSGALIKFRTDRISDVGRLVAGLHRLARSMANLKDIPPDATTTTATATAVDNGEASTVGKDAVAGAVAAAEGDVAASAGGAKGKKKNKKKR
ncbi:hypothetical protein TWF696_006294 [Orbilia brochopaga]|uniref:SRP9 domain-containing protein n=1 Tax=Orbilia brochopaga TaxID=3140254 RepID=A0AAV9UVV4_9PEZI